MFVALRISDRSRVTSLAAQWDNRLNELRELAASGQLMCPGCEQLLWFRIGINRRRHFAHRHLADCPLAHQSAELLEAKAQLFKWLETKYGGRVQLEAAVGVPGRDKPADLLVEPQTGRKFAYWVFDRQQRSREDLLAYQRLPGVHVHFIHTQSTRVMHSSTEIALTASQRDFMRTSEYDRFLGYGGCGHLHFLDGENSKLRIYRGLVCVHEPNLFGWEALREDLLSAARISPKTGEMVLPEDVAARDKWRQKLEAERVRKAQEEERARRTQEEEQARREPPPKPPLAPEPAPVPALTAEVQPRRSESTAVVEKPAAPSLKLNGPFRCEDCGVETMNWSSATPSAGTCVCRSCTRKRHQRLTAS
jgi:hypothetical protein